MSRQNNINVRPELRPGNYLFPSENCTALSDHVTSVPFDNPEAVLDSPLMDGYKDSHSYLVPGSFAITKTDKYGLNRKRSTKECECGTSRDSCYRIPVVASSQGKGAYTMSLRQSTREISVSPKLDKVVSTRTNIVRNCNSPEISQQAEIEAKSNLSLMLKDEEQGEEVLALPSPGTLNDMMSKVQKKRKKEKIRKKLYICR
uniref:Uncharacterized protein n=1 Tax=Setaria digitata TaxID=48799 RepID=A0A915PYR8_9BILA